MQVCVQNEQVKHLTPWARISQAFLQHKGIRCDEIESQITSNCNHETSGWFVAGQITKSKMHKNTHFKGKNQIQKCDTEIMSIRPPKAVCSSQTLLQQYIMRTRKFRLCCWLMQAAIMRTCHNTRWSWLAAKCAVIYGTVLHRPVEIAPTAANGFFFFFYPNIGRKSSIPCKLSRLRQLSA